MDKPLPTPTQPYRNLIAGYTEAIRASDFKANIAFLFVAFMMGSVLWNYTSFPEYLSIQLVLLPFLIVYFFLFLVLIPRYPKRGARFPGGAQPQPRISNRRADCRRHRAVEADLRGAVRHSWWKTQCIRVGFLLAIVCVFLTLFLLLYVSFT